MTKIEMKLHPLYQKFLQVAEAEGYDTDSRGFVDCANGYFEFFLMGVNAWELRDVDIARADAKADALADLIVQRLGNVKDAHIKEEVEVAVKKERERCRLLAVGRNNLFFTNAQQAKGEHILVFRNMAQAMADLSDEIATGKEPEPT